MQYLGDFDTTETVHIPFNTFTSDDPSASVTVTNLAAGDIEIHKDGSATQRASDNGVTVDIDFDSITGNHMVHIDLSDNSDAGFYAAGSRYQVRLEGITVDGATLNVWIGTFSIGCTLRPTTAGRTLDADASGKVLLSDGAHGGSAAVLTLERIIVASTTAGQPAVKLTGNTSGAGLLATGGADSGNGMTLLGGASDGLGLYARGDGAGAGIRGDGGDNNGVGINAVGGSTNGHGISGVGSGTGSGLYATSGAGANGNGITAVAASDNGDGIRSTGAGSGHGISGAGGLTGHGMSVVGGGTSGHGVYAKAAGTGNGIDAHGGGIEGDGIHAIADNDGDGVEAVAAGAGNVDIRADITGNITGNVSGSVGSVTGNVGGNVTGTVGELAAQAKADVNAQVDASIEDYKLDHLVAAADADDVADDSIIAKLAASDGDWSGFDKATDSLEAVRDKETDIEDDTAEIGAAGVGLTEAGGDGDHLTEVSPADGSIASGTFAAGALDAAAAAADLGTELATALLDLANGVETSYTLRQAMRLVLAALVGKLSGAETTTVTIRDIGDTTDRIIATVDADGNRSAVTPDAT
jgi:hypothetical protein